MADIAPTLFLSDLKQEIVPVLENAWKELDIDVKVWAPITNPSTFFPHTDFNTLEAPIDCYWNDRYLTEDTGTHFRAQLDITNPAPEPDALNVFFSGNGRRAKFGIAGSLIVNEPEIATEGEVFKIASDPKRAKELMREAAMQEDSEHDFFANDVSRACRSVLSACEGRNEHHFADFLSYVSNPIVAFDEAGHLGQSGKHAVARISDIRKGDRPKIIVCSVPLSHLGDMRIPISLFANSVFTSIKMHPHGRAVHACLDEFTALNLPNYHRDVITLRGLGCTSEVYIQSRHAAAQATSEKAEATIFDQSDIVTYSAISDYKTAEAISQSIGSMSKKGFSANVADRFDTVNFGVQDVDVPVITPQALMALPRDKQIIQVRGMRPIKSNKLPFWDLDGFRELCADNPLEGPMPKTKAKAKIKISKTGVRIVLPKPPKRLLKTGVKQKSLPRAINPASFVWLILAAVIYTNAVAWIPSVSLPALRMDLAWISSSYDRYCRYIALDRQWYVKSGARCPLVTWIGEGQRR